MRNSPTATASGSIPASTAALAVVATTFSACQCRRRNDIIHAVAGRRTMNDLTIAEPIAADAIRSRILTIRGVQVMLDRDLAELYGVPTKVLNQAVKRNIDRFPKRFMFQLTKEEVSNLRSQSVTSSTEAEVRSQNVTLDNDNRSRILRSQIVTSSWGGMRYLPYAFTEHGIIMLASVLNSPTEVKASPTSWQRCERHRKNRQTAKFRKTNFPTCF